MPIRVILADDHGVLRDGLKLLLESNGILVVGEAENGAVAVDLARRLQPQVVIADYAMPVMNGIEAAAEIRKELGIPTILLTMHSEQSYIRHAFQAGVAGYILKSQAASALVDAIHEVAHGNSCLSPGISRVVIDEMLDPGSRVADTLTVREQQVLKLIAEGETTKEAARRLDISVRTGESHRAKLMEKLNIHEISGLVRYAVREGLLQP